MAGAIGYGHLILATGARQTAARRARRRPAGRLHLAHHRRRDRDPRKARPGTQGRRHRRRLHRARDRRDRGGPRRRGDGRRDRPADGARRLERDVGFLSSRRMAASARKFRIGRGVLGDHGRRQGRGRRADRRRGPAGRPRHRRRRRHGRGSARARLRARMPERRRGRRAPANARTRRFRRSATAPISPRRRSASAPGWNRCRTPSTRRAAWRRASPARPAPYDALAWFWSDQGDLKLMIAGLLARRRRLGRPRRSRDARLLDLRLP